MAGDRSSGIELRLCRPPNYVQRRDVEKKVVERLFAPTRVTFIITVTGTLNAKCTIDNNVSPVTIYLDVLIVYPLLEQSDCRY